VIDPKTLSAVDRPTERAFTLPGPIFSEPSIFALEMRRVFHNSWQCVGTADEVPRPGDYRTVELGGSGVMMIRGKDGALRAFHNVCRHRGTRLLGAPEGSGLRAIRCPYHAWTYDLEGNLVAAPHMDGIEGFERRGYGLYPVRLEEWRGFVFLNLHPGAPPLEEALGPLARRASSYPLERLRRAHRVVYEIAANWKLVLENANECYHCPGIHPQLNAITPYRSGQEDAKDGPVIGGWMDLAEGFKSLTHTGETRRHIFPGLREEDRRRVYYYSLFPANVFSLLPDYVTFDWFVPLAPDRTLCTFDIYVDQDIVDKADDAMSFWDETNRQDWRICEMAHLGSRSMAFTQGRYSGEEESVHAFDRFYVRAMGFAG
jgi:Rieske 2Fe-2S family protein